MRSSFNIF